MIEMKEPLASLPDDYADKFEVDLFEDVADLQAAEGTTDLRQIGAAVNVMNRIVWLVVTDGKESLPHFREWKGTVSQSEVRGVCEQMLTAWFGGSSDDSPLDE